MGKTNYNYPAEPASDHWGNTVANIKPLDNNEQDFSKTYMPSSQNPKTPDWGVTEANIKLPQDDFGAKQENFGESSGASNSGGGSDYGATMPYFRLPEAERAKYQTVPLTPTQEVEKQKQEEKEKGGIPVWAWITGGSGFGVLFESLTLLFSFI